MFNDLRLNITVRSEMKNRKEEFRKTYRIPVNEYLKTDKGQEVYTEDFNYNYIVLKAHDNYEELMTIIPGDGIELKCKYVKHINDKEKLLYRVLNAEKVAFENKLEYIVEKWISKNLAE